MIPKIIHYCWLSNDTYPDNIQKCINSWKKKLPDYKIMLWDLNRSKACTSEWVNEAYSLKRYAFAADYIRFYALYHYGGIYLDSDVEVIRNFDSLLKLPYFIGFDSFGYFEAAVIGCEPQNPWIKECLEYYKNRHFILQDGVLDTQPLPGIMYNSISKKFVISKLNVNYSDYHLDKNLYVHPYQYFSPKRHDTGKIKNQNYTYTIHHYAMSWIPTKIQFLVKIKQILMLFFGSSTIEYLIKIFSLKKIKERILSNHK